MLRPDALSPKARKIAVIGSFVVILIALCILFLPKGAKKQDDERYAKYIDAYTAGTISKKGKIRVHLTNASKGLLEINRPDERNLFDLSPSVKGKTVWIDNQTVEFRPEEDLAPGKSYTVTFSLDKVTEVEKGLDDFEFDFKVISPGLQFKDFGMISQNNTSLDYMKITGEALMSDSEEIENIQKTLETSFKQKLRIKWQHNPDKNSSQFTIDSIKKSSQPQKLTLKWNGDAINAENRGVMEYTVPALGVMDVLAIRAVQDEESYALVQFSEPVGVGQDLNGLISLGDLTDLSFTIDGSQVKVYAPDVLNGNYELKTFNGIENINGRKLTTAKSAALSFQDQLPGVEIVGAGTILPNSGKLILPFDAINLKSVDVTIIKIYENNIPQFFQTNSYLEANDLRRVARPVLQKTISLNEDGRLDLHKKNRFSLDLDKLIKTEPGAMYRVTIGFRHEYSVYNCTADSAQVKKQEEDYPNYGDLYPDNGIDEDDDFWQRYNSFYPDNYNWDDEGNPCTPSYYTHDKWVSRNLIASNIGIVAKKGNDNNMLIITTDLLTAKPLSGVKIDLIDYQKQLIETVKTDGDGLVSLSLRKQPVLLIARNGNDRGYLQTFDAGSLPLSRFDVGGEQVQKGIKGFIYGERGVWRPGDSLFLSFILEDKLKKLPENYPVTLELYSPRGQLNKKLINARPVNGIYVFKTATDATSPTGNWIARVKAGGALFSKTLKIETIMPNRLKIGFDIGNKTYLSSGTGQASLSANWLFGATGRNLKAKVDVNLNTAETIFKNFPGYSFDNPVVNFQSQAKTIFEGTLNQNGTAAVNTNMGENSTAPGVLRANFTTKVFEPGGNFSLDYFSIPYHVYSNYLGIRTPEGDRLSGMLLTGKDHKIDIVNVNQEGLLLNTSKTVEVALFKVQWRWWWEQDDRYTYSNFTQNEYNKLIKKATVKLTAGRGTWNLRINEPEWGRYLILVGDTNGGHVTGKSIYIDWPGWAKREQGTNPTEASMLSFTANKTKFKVGENITLTIPSAENGRALISLENGSRVVKTFWVDTKKGQTQYTFRAEKSMAPNIFANITLLQPHAQTINDLPIRMYGAIPLSVEDPETTLNPQVQMAASIKPESSTVINVSEKNGKAMTYTLAVVDEGLLDLTRFKTPNPHGAFYAHEGLGVKTWDMFDYVLGAWGKDMERILSIGGDGTINRNINPAKANRFKPVLKFMGPFQLKKGERKAHVVKLPQYIGSVRVMIVAAEDGAYGFAERTARVKKPLMLLATLPRVIGPGETFSIPVSVFATEPELKNVNVQLYGNNLIIDGSRMQLIRFDQPGEQLLYFNVKAPEAAGLAKIRITAQSGNEKAVYYVEMDVRNPNPYVTNVVNATIQPKQTWAASYKPLGMEGTNSGVVEVSSVPPMNFNKRLNYLIRYPHGCIEQTVSSAFPQLFLGKIMALNQQQKTTSDRNIKLAVNKLRGYQLPDGSLSYWPGEGSADDWGTNYAAHFLVEAQSAGFTLPVGLLDDLFAYQRKKAINWTPNSSNFYGGDIAQAYRLYTLALARKPEMAAMNRLKGFQYLTVAAKWRLAAAYQLAGQGKAAGQLTAGLPLTVNPYNQLGGTYGSDTRDQAMILETLTLMGQKNKAAQLLQTIAAKLGSETWFSTQTTAYSLLAIAKFCGETQSAKRIQYTASIDGTTSTVNSGQYLTTSAIKFNGERATITNTGNNVLFVRLILSGQPVAGQNTFLPASKNTLEMSVSYRELNGKVLNPVKLKQGTDFYAEVRVKNPGKLGLYEQMALTQIFPSGWEIINTRLNDNEGSLAASPYTYRDIRDDRVLTYFNIREYETLTYKVLLNASYTGRYYLSAVQCEAMYNNNISATQAGKWVEVVK